MRLIKMEKPTICTSQDILQLANYAGSIDPKLQTLRRIVTGYNITDEISCGLKSCHQPHKEGYLVELEDGHVSNVGWKCGAHYGEKFATEERRYRDDVLRPTAIQHVQMNVPKIQSLRAELDQLSAQADRLSTYKQRMRNKFPRLYLELDRRAHSGKDIVTEDIERSNDEINTLQDLNPGGSRERFRYREVSRGILPGLRVLALNIRDEIISRLTGKAAALVSADIASLATDQLLEWQQWAFHFDETLQRARDIVASANALFTPQSFQLMAYLANDSKEKAALQTLTTSILLESDSDVTRPARPNHAPMAMSKKQRDIQKRLEAIQRNAKYR